MDFTQNSPANWSARLISQLLKNSGVAHNIGDEDSSWKDLAGSLPGKVFWIFGYCPLRSCPNGLFLILQHSVEIALG